MAIQVIDRMTQLLDVIARAKEPVSLKVLSAETGLHPSTAFRILASLAEYEYVERDEVGNYMLGLKLMLLGSRVRQGIKLRQAARQVIEQLRDELGETVNLTIRDADEVVYIERASSNLRMIRVEQVVGSRAPLHVTAVGKMILGAEGEESCRAYCQRTGLPAYTKNTITDPERLVEVTQRDFLRGYAMDDEEAEEGVGCIGVLVYGDNQQIVAGLSVSAPIERRRNEWLNSIIEAGKQLSRRLGC